MLDQKGFVNQHGLSKKHIFDSVKKSLERLSWITLTFSSVCPPHPPTIIWKE
jgi:aryl-alcohol dehydrogenase-like predicted oxidoreductase